MPATPIIVTDAEREGLETLVRRHTTAQQIVTRARIVLAAAAGQTNVQIVQQVGLSRESVRLWRDRWAALQEIPLVEVSVAEQVCQIVALACAAPATAGRPISQWSSREIADEITVRGIVATISPRHAARLLNRGRSSRI